MSTRALELLTDLRAEILDMRIKVAQERDGQLTEQELIAMLEVYGEFSR